MKKLYTLLLVLFALIQVQAITLAPDPNAFITTWKTTTANESITIPTNSANYTYNYEIDWDNGGIYEVTGSTGNASHTFATVGNHIIAIRGTFPAIYFNSGGDKNKILSVDQWGTINWKSMELAFAGCVNLEGAANDVPNLTDVTTMFGMFFNATAFNQHLGSWDVSKVTHMGSMFAGATAFNGNIGSWDVRNVTRMDFMFFGATAFNQNIGSWNVSKVIYMYGMFDGGTSFNQDIGRWNVSKVTNMNNMFRGATSFN